MVVKEDEEGVGTTGAAGGAPVVPFFLLLSRARRGAGASSGCLCSALLLPSSWSAAPVVVRGCCLLAFENKPSIMAWLEECGCSTKQQNTKRQKHWAVDNRVVVVVGLLAWLSVPGREEETEGGNP